MNLPKIFTENKKYEWTQMKELDWFMYIRDYDNRPIGIIIIDKNKCGYSICNDKDEWDKAFGVFKAIMRLCSQKTLEEVKDEFLYKLGDEDAYGKQYYWKCALVIDTLLYIESIFKRTRKEK